MEATVLAFWVGVGVLLQNMDVVLGMLMHEVAAETDARSGAAGASRNRAGFDPDVAREGYLVSVGFVGWEKSVIDLEVDWGFHSMDASLMIGE